MSDYHESRDALNENTADQTRALHSLKEEIEAADWYNQRADGVSDGSLKEILLHNRNEEIEHAAMLIEWLRRHMDGWEEQLRTYLFSNRNILQAEEGASGSGSEPVKSTNKV